MSKSSLSILAGRGSVAAACFVAASALTSAARADDQPMGKPPAEAKALVDAPKAGEAAPKVETPTDETTATVSAGGQLATGNSQLAAATVNGKFEMRRQENGFAASLLGNYGESAPPGQDLHVTAQNLQGRLRYDRYLIDRLSLFGMATGRYDKLQGLDFRLNLDPGVKYLLVLTDPTQVWVEAGYDYQHDIRSSDVVASTGVPKTQEDHSVRLFAGLKHAFNKEVNVSTGIEFLQSLVDGSRTRLNYDALLAANVGGGFAVGLGFTARYDYSHGGIAGKKDLDTATTFSLIYAFSDAAPPPPPPTCVPAEPPPPPPPPPQSAPPPAPPPPPPANPQ